MKVKSSTLTLFWYTTMSLGLAAFAVWMWDLSVETHQPFFGWAIAAVVLYAQFDLWKEYFQRRQDLS